LFAYYYLSESLTLLIMKFNANFEIDNRNIERCSGVALGDALRLHTIVRISDFVN